MPFWAKKLPISCHSHYCSHFLTHIAASSGSSLTTISSFSSLQALRQQQICDKETTKNLLTRSRSQCFEERHKSGLLSSWNSSYTISDRKQKKETMKQMTWILLILSTSLLVHTGKSKLITVFRRLTSYAFLYLITFSVMVTKSPLKRKGLMTF